MPSVPNSNEQWVNNASVKIEEKGSTGSRRTFRIIASGINDDARRSTTLVVLLPRNVEVKSRSGEDGIVFGKGFRNTYYQIHGAHSQQLPNHQIYDNIDSYVEFKIRNMGTTEDFCVDVSVSPVDENYEKNDTVSAFVYSNTPEREKQNNHFVLDL